MDMNNVKGLKFTTLSAVQRKLTKNNANDGNNAEEEFGAINNRLRKKKHPEYKQSGSSLEGDSTVSPFSNTPATLNGLGTTLLSDQKEDILKRTMLFYQPEASLSDNSEA